MKELLRDFNKDCFKLLEEAIEDYLKESFEKHLQEPLEVFQKESLDYLRNKFGKK